jgi:acetylglutamate kinase
MGCPGCISEYFKRIIMSNFSSAKEKLFVIKIGGNVIDDAQKLDSFLKEFSSIESKKILVHGGGKIATSIGNQLNIQSKYVDGRRITDDETIDLVTMVYGGLLNKKIIAKLQSLHCNAIGITGADANLLPAKKKKSKRN